MREFTFCSVSSCSLSLSYSSQASASSTNKLALDRNSSRPLRLQIHTMNQLMKTKQSRIEDANATEWQMQQNDAPDYLIRSFLALSAWEAAKPASLSAIFFFFHSINSAGVICVAVCSFARWNIEQENVGLTTYVQGLSSYEQIGKTGRELNLVFDFVLNCQLLWWLLFQEGFHLRFKDISRRKCVSVMTLFATIGAWPEPPILFLFHSIQKILANLLYISKHKKLQVNELGETNNSCV